jgi:hypothetical protein
MYTNINLLDTNPYFDCNKIYAQKLFVSCIYISDGAMLKFSVGLAGNAFTTISLDRLFQKTSYCFA